MTFLMTVLNTHLNIPAWLSNLMRFVILALFFFFAIFLCIEVNDIQKRGQLQ